MNKENTVTINGVANVRNQSYDSLLVNGAANLEHVTIVQKLEVNGTCNVESCTITHAFIKGALSVEDSTISGKTHVIGNANFEDSILKEVETTSRKVVFEDCKVESITMAQWDDWWFFKRTRKVILEDTVVSGDITFEDEGGVVILKGSSKIEGSIVGGSVQE